jgi:uncharacterized protein with PQ loop repeat
MGLIPRTPETERIADILATIAIILSSIGVVAQILNIVQSGHSEGVSYWAIGIRLLAMLLWLGFGVILEIAATIASSIVHIVLLIALFFVARSYKTRRPPVDLWSWTRTRDKLLQRETPDSETLVQAVATRSPYAGAQLERRGRGG